MPNRHEAAVRLSPERIAGMLGLETFDVRGAFVEGTGDVMLLVDGDPRLPVKEEMCEAQVVPLGDLQEINAARRIEGKHR